MHKYINIKQFVLWLYVYNLFSVFSLRVAAVLEHYMLIV